jgi:phage gpG-like protein
VPERLGFDVVFNPNPTVVAQAFFASAQRAQNLVPPMEKIIEEASNEIAENFAAEGRPTKWPSLAESTIAKRGTDGPILVDTGELEAEATDPSSWAIVASGQSVVASLNVRDDSKFHLTGTQFMPQRDWAYLSPQWDDFVDQEMYDWILAPLGV